MEEFTSTDGKKEKKIKFEERKKGELSSFGLSKLNSFLEEYAWKLNRTEPEMYLLFSVTPLRSFYVANSKCFEEATVSYIGGGKLIVGEGGRANIF